MIERSLAKGWNKMELSVDRYLARIGMERSPFLTYDYLRRLQLNHQMSVPYETLDILYQAPNFTLKLEDVYDKVVNRRRGGYCFELNLLFGWLLRQLGFNVIDHFARFLRGSESIPMRRHRVLRVECEGREYIADVGVGSKCPKYPMLLSEGLEQNFDGECYCYERDRTLGWVCMEQKGDSWRPMYSFTDEPNFDIDFEAIHFYCRYCPDVEFRTKAVASLRTEEGRCTLSDREFRNFTLNGVETYTASTDAEFKKALDIYFGIKL